jgi:hypothetical protein
MKLLRYAAMVLFIGSAYTSVHAQQSTPAEVLVLDDEDALPDGARLIDNIKIVGGSRLDCGYRSAVSRAKDKAFEKGGNVVKITDVKFPNDLASCVRMRAEVYSAPNITGLVKKKEQAWDSTMHSLVPADAPYALLYVFRPSNGTGGLIQYNLHADDSLIGRVTNGGKFVVKLPHTGQTQLWARTESRKEVPLDVKPGHVYFLKCSVRMGVMVGHPYFELVDDYEGYMEYTQGNLKDEKVIAK